jgi:hypothetical protein
MNKTGSSSDHEMRAADKRDGGRPVRNIVVSGSLPSWRLPMPRYFFNVEDGHRLFDPTGFVCDDDVAAVIRGSVLAIGVSLDRPEDDPERRIAIIHDQGREIGTVPVYSKPSFEHPAK